MRFEPTISAGKRPQTYALDRAANGTGKWKHRFNKTAGFTRSLTALYFRTLDCHWCCSHATNSWVCPVVISSWMKQRCMATVSIQWHNIHVGLPLPGDTLRPMLPTVTTQTRSNFKNGLNLYAQRLSLNWQMYCLTCPTQSCCFKIVNFRAHNRLAFKYLKEN